MLRNRRVKYLSVEISENLDHQIFRELQKIVVSFQVGMLSKSCWEWLPPQRKTSLIFSRKVGLSWKNKKMMTIEMITVFAHEDNSSL